MMRSECIHTIEERERVGSDMHRGESQPLEELPGHMIIDTMEQALSCYRSHCHI